MTWRWRIQSVPQPDGSRDQWSETRERWVPAGDPSAASYLHPEDARDRLGAIRCAGVSGAFGAQVVEVASAAPRETSE